MGVALFGGSFDETLRGGAGVTRNAFAQFFSHLLQAGQDVPWFVQDVR
jgi:hypothetical protein